MLLPFKDYLETKEIYDETKAERDRLHNEVVALQEKNKPAIQLKQYVLQI